MQPHFVEQAKSASHRIGHSPRRPTTGIRIEKGPREI
jgi:hypothetical protein